MSPAELPMLVVEWVKGTAAVVRRELLSLFVTPLAYLVGTLFLLNQGWNFALLLRFLNDPLAAPGPVMQFFFGGSFFIFWLPVIFITAFPERLLTGERPEPAFLISKPYSETQVRSAVSQAMFFAERHL